MHIARTGKILKYPHGEDAVIDEANPVRHVGWLAFNGKLTARSKEDHFEAFRPKPDQETVDAGRKRAQGAVSVEADGKEHAEGVVEATKEAEGTEGVEIEEEDAEKADADRAE